MNEDVLWLLKMVFILYCLWFIWGGPERAKQDFANQKTSIKAPAAAVYQPKTYNQTIILK
jgi:hypothetical protein